MEGDSLNVVRALQGLLPPLVLVMSIIYWIQSSCNDVRKVVFSHVCRQGNRPSLQNMLYLLLTLWFGWKRILVFWNKLSIMI